jgi:hypothetical protein
MTINLDNKPMEINKIELQIVDDSEITSVRVSDSDFETKADVIQHSTNYRGWDTLYTCEKRYCKLNHPPNPKTRGKKIRCPKNG